MMRGYSKNRNKLNLLLLVFVLLLTSAIVAQSQRSSQTIIQDGDTIVLQAIPLTNITKNIEIAIKEIGTITEESKPNDKINSADSLYLVAVVELENESKFLTKTENFTNRVLDDALQQWSNYKTNLAEWQSLISDRSVMLSNNTNKIDKLIIIWDLTLNDARKENAPKGIILNLRDVINELESLKNNLRTKILSIYTKQSKLTELALYIEETIKNINLQKKSLRKAYLTQDSPAIWNAYDSTFVSSMNKEVLTTSINETTKALSVFQTANKDNFYIHLFIFLILIALLYYLQKYAITTELTDEAVIKAKKVLNNYFLSALILGVIVTVWIYPTRQLVVDDIFQFILLILITLFLPNVSNKKFRVVLYYSLVIHLVNQMQLFLPTTSLISRLLMFVEIALVFMVLKNLLSKEGELYAKIKASKWNFILPLIRLFYLMLLVSVIANIFGFVGLATLANNIVVNSLFNAFIAFTGLFIVVNTVTLIFRSDHILMLNSIRKYNKQILTNIIKYTTVLAFLFWATSVLTLFGVYKNFVKWLSGIFLTSWQFGDILIDLGSVLSFIMVIIVTFILVKVIRVILEEEIFVRIKLPRGVPGAVSMVIRYFIVGWGIVISINALGIDLSQFGLMAGALGVGIGFGLQNIVFNFIAGLILAFERPIQVGDTIETGTVMGTVKSIGVRSSTILTFDGSEVIVPNGNLISNEVINWTLTDRRKRQDIFVGVEYGSDPHAVMEVLRQAADGNVNVLQNPEPWILFEGFGDSSLNFRLRIWTSMDVGLTTKSQVTIAIYDGLNEAGITIPFPQQDLHVKSIEPEIEKILLHKNKPTRLTKKTSK